MRHSVELEFVAPLNCAFVIQRTARARRRPKGGRHENGMVQRGSSPARVPFVRVPHVLLPPVSRASPASDRAVLARSGGAVTPALD